MGIISQLHDVQLRCLVSLSLLQWTGINLSWASEVVGGTKLKIEKSYDVRDHWKVCESPGQVIGPRALLLIGLLVSCRKLLS